MPRAVAFASLLVFHGCGGAQTQESREPTPPHAAPEEQTTAEVDDPSESDAGEMEQTPAGPAPQLDFSSLRPGFRECSERLDPDSPGFAECACNLICAAHFDAPAGGVRVRIRFPFVDVDGVTMMIEPDGSVSHCSYALGARSLADQDCAAILNP